MGYMFADDQLDAIFLALASPVRRRVIDVVRESPGLCVGDVAEAFEDEMSRVAVMKHLKVLTEANLVASLKEGRQRRLYFNAVPIQMIYGRWSTEFGSLFSQHATRLKYAVELNLSDHDDAPRRKSRRNTTTKKKDTSR